MRHSPALYFLAFTVGGTGRIPGQAHERSAFRAHGGRPPIRAPFDRYECLGERGERAWWRERELKGPGERVSVARFEEKRALMFDAIILIVWIKWEGYTRILLGDRLREHTIQSRKGLYMTPKTARFSYMRLIEMQANGKP